jgi:prepilin-type N-terminal cleavage/methylation domain-containing protein
MKTYILYSIFYIRERGFTLIETMVAVSILTLAVAGPLFTANRAIVAAQIARDQLTASSLAQEGIEYVRAMRDNEFLGAYPTDAGWANFISGIENYCLGALCTLDPIARDMGYGSGLALEPCSGSCTPLYRRSDGMYTQQSGGGSNVQTIFTRTIQVTRVTATDEKIASVVSWDSHGTRYAVSISDHLTPWQ